MEVGILLGDDLSVDLRKSPLFSPLSDKEFADILGKLQLQKVPFGKVLRSETPGQILILVEGKIRLLERLPSGEESSIATLETVGDYWSNEWLHGSATGSLTARASSPAKIITLEPSVCADISSVNKEFSAHLKTAMKQWQSLCILRLTSPFNLISVNKLRQMSRYFRQESFAPNNDVWTDKAGVYVVTRGLVECLDNTEQRTRVDVGQMLTVGGVGPFASDSKGFRAVEQSEILVLTEEDFRNLENHAPELISAVFAHDSAKHNASPQNYVPATETVADKPAAQVEKAEDESIPSRISRLFHQYPFIMQQSQMDCGITCLAMVALFYGKRLDINELRERASVSVEGTTMLALAETAESLGFMSRGLRATYEALLNAKLPLICFWKNNHFVVLYEINKKEARIGDPAEGLITVPREEFSRAFTKHALELIPTVELKRAPGSKNPLTILLPLLKPFGPQVRDVLAAAVIYQVLMIITPFFSQTIVDRVIVHEDISMLNMLLLGMILVSCFQAALSFARGALISTLSTKIDHALFVQFFKHLFSLPLKYFEQRTTGDILARFNENARITAFLSGTTITVLLDGTIGIVYLAVLFYYSWAFGLAALAYISLLIISTAAYTPLLRGYSNELFKKNVANDSCVIESVHGVEKIKAAAAENRIRWKWEILFVDKLAVSFRQQLASNGYTQVTQLVHLLGRILLMYLGAHLVISKQFTVGQYMAANMMAGMCVDPIMRVLSMWQQLQSVNISVERLGDVFRAAPEQVGQKTRLPQVAGDIELRNVTFRYSDHASKNTLLNVSVRMQPNQMVAIVGRSGCGKTTLVRLVQGLYMPSGGSILIDGVDTAQIELSDLRKAIGVVAQQEFFFTGTVRENLAFYAPDAPLEEIIIAAKVAGIHDKIQSLGSGYDTLLSEGGNNLSGGEKQRMAIARALLHRPKILIFDEATSALDSESERHIQAALEAIRKGRTMIVVAHRLSTIKSADLILVMEQGQIVEAGNHQSLIDKKGLYFHLCSQQSI